MGHLKSIYLQGIKKNIFNESEFGKPISDDLSATLRRNITKDYMADIATQTGISFSTIRDVVYRTNSLTAGNSVAIGLLVKTAFENSLARKRQNDRDIVFLERILKF